jgi:hypothetical protein
MNKNKPNDKATYTYVYTQDGYQPSTSKLNINNPPKGGSAVPPIPAPSKQESAAVPSVQSNPKK